MRFCTRCQSIHGDTCPKRKSGWGRRPKTASRGYGAKWRKAREQYLAEHPLCRECGRSGKVTAATVVDHIVPHKGDAHLMWSRTNWQPLCGRCHAQKTGREQRAVPRADAGILRRTVER